MVVAIVIAAIAAAAAIALAIYVDANRNGEAREIERAFTAGYVEKQADVAVAVPGADFLGQTEVSDPALYYTQHGYLFSMFGGLQAKMAQWAQADRTKNPDAPLTFAFIPRNWTRGMYFYNDFDPRFTEAFYDGSWMAGIDQQALVAAIDCPTVYLKAKTRYGADGILYAANTDEDASLVVKLLRNGEKVEIESGHDIHYEHADVFCAAVDQAAGREEGASAPDASQ